MKKGHNVGTAVVLEKRFYFPLFILVFFLFLFPMSFDSLQLINHNVMTTNNDLLIDELKVSYFAPKLWLYIVIWLPRTTDNSTHFAQSLEIGGIESRPYSYISARKPDD